MFMRQMRLAGAALALCAAAGIGVAAQAPHAPQATARKAASGAGARPAPAAAEPFLTAELIFPLEHWHNHSSAIVETPGGDLLVCWFHGSGERTADDVLVQGARLKKGRQWSARFLLADTPGYPDTNATLLIDPQQRLWMFLADHPRERVADRADEIQARADRGGQRRAEVGHERGDARHAGRRVQDDDGSRHE